MENVLEVKNLCKKYDNFELKNVTFHLPKGMIMGLIGENGAGKTTIIKAILDIIKPSSGEIKIFGIDKKEEKVKEEIGVVLDDMFFPEILTPNDINNTMKSIYQNWDENMFYDYLKEFSLLPKKQIKTFSKGMRKKLEIITALSHHPKLLILDEPTSGLDPVARDEVIEIFQSILEKDDCSILLSSHITTDLEHIADYITFINNGKVLLSKETDELLNQYGIVKCTEKEFKTIHKKDYIKYKKTKYEYEVLVENKKEFKAKYNISVIDKITLDDLMVLMIKGGRRMIGLIKKDIAMIKSNFKLLGILIVVYAVMRFLEEMDISFILPFMSIMIMISTFSYDNYNQWDAYSISLPNGRRNSVKSKYVTTILMILIVSLITMMLSFLISYVNTNTINYEQILIAMFGNIFGTFLVLSFLYPIIYKFGLEKARIGIFLVVFGIVIIGGFLSRYFDLSFVGRTLSFLEDYLVILLIIIMIVMVYLSYKISEKIFHKKEF